MSLSAWWHWRTSVTMLSWPGKTHSSCSLRPAVSSVVLSRLTVVSPLMPPWCLCWTPPFHPFPCTLPLSWPPPYDASRAPLGVRSWKFKTSVLERGGLMGKKGAAKPANEWFPGLGVLTGNKGFQSENMECQIQIWVIKHVRFLHQVTLLPVPRMQKFI